MFRYNIQTSARIALCAVLTFVGICVAFTSCVSERTADALHISEEDGKILELTLIPHTEQTTTTTLRSHVGEEPGDKENGLHGVSILNENKIESIELFVFDPTLGQLVGRYTPSKQEALTGSEIGSRATFIIPKGDLPKLEGKQLDYISVVNARTPIVESVKTKTALYEQIQDDQSKLNPAPQNGQIAPQDKFLMDGKLQTTVTWGSQKPSAELGTIDLYRAAAKIRLRIDHIEVKDYQNGIETPYVVNPDTKPEVCLVRYPEKTKVVRSDSPYQPNGSDWHNSAYRPMVETDYATLGYKNSRGDGKFYGTVPFYAYEHDWRSTLTNETFLRLKLTMRPKDAKDSDRWVDYYYRIPVNYRKALGEVTEDMLHKLERNHLYDVLTSIEVLGSLNEDTPVDITSNVAITPWNLIEAVDGELLKAQYLEVYDRRPFMAAVSEISIPYASSLPVEIEIDSAWYEYYDKRGVHYRREFSKTESKLYKINGTKTLVKSEPNKSNWDGIEITPSKNYLSNGVITIKHPVPVNYIPYHIKFTVKQKGGGLLSQVVRVLQYPNRFVTGERSQRFRNGKEKLVEGNTMKSVYADFRYHSTIGIFGRYQGETTSSPQVNEVNFKITTLVPKPGERIGSPVDPITGKTKTDKISNQLISPQFIIASQHGMSSGTYQRLNDVPQEHKHKQRFRNQPFSADYPHYGPWSDSYWGSYEPYYSPANYNQYVYLHDNRRDYAIKQPIKGSCLDAETRCYEYFEGEFGTVGNYTEYYNIKWQQDYYGRRDITWQTRTIHKEFKYQGRWRIPTSAEMKLIDEMQRDPNTEIEGLLFGSYYWVAEEGMVYDFKNRKIIPASEVKPEPYYYDDVVEMKFPTVFVRPIFDTYMYDEQ
ncbi:hypothetical protein [Porphyromonas levii]|uniref:fimbrial tip adhesin FimD n=1 Tax=Porphyromonas levii TaxID=28114 RepID=UPI001BA5FB8A|nr:hypothetical protein [Porphyromonas levii]MBR8704049.1 hypothetical protein [Porphyromonas levii]